MTADRMIETNMIAIAPKIMPTSFMVTSVPTARMTKRAGRHKCQRCSLLGRKLRSISKTRKRTADTVNNVHGCSKKSHI